MKKSKLVAWLVIIILSLILAACDTSPQQELESAVTSSVAAVEPIMPEKSSSEEEYFVIIENEKEPLSKALVPEDATEVKRIDNGVSLVSATSFEATVELYKELIGEYQIDGKEATVDIETLGVEQCWKFDGTHDDRLFSITVASSEGGTVGVAIIY